MVSALELGVDEGDAAKQHVFDDVDSEGPTQVTVRAQDFVRNVSIRLDSVGPCRESNRSLYSQYLGIVTFASCYAIRTACGCCLCLPLLLDVERLQGEQQFEVEKGVFLNPIPLHADMIFFDYSQEVLTLVLPKSDADHALLKSELLRRAQKLQVAHSSSWRVL